MKKSNDLELRKRGFVAEDEIVNFSYLSNEGILAFIQSKSPAKRTIAAKLIIKSKNITFVIPKLVISQSLF
jgi:hypothetical protein